MDNIHEYIRALEIPWISYEYGYAPDIEGRCLGSSIQKLSPGKEKIQKKRGNKGDSGELYNIQYIGIQHTQFGKHLLLFSDLVLINIVIL